MRARRFLGVAAVVLLAAGPAVPALAQAGPGTSFVDRTFTDLGSYAWAKPAIAWVAARGLISGDGRGRFGPALPTTRLEAIAVTVRSIGGASAPGANALSGYFLDAGSVPSWAQSYVLTAVQRGILPLSQDGLLRPNEPATRIWSAVLMVKALGLEAEARARMQATLPYRDAALIPRDLVGYVAVAYDRNLMRGDSTGAFQPQRTVTRAEMAVMLARMDQMNGLAAPRPGELRGAVVSVDTTRGQVSIQTSAGLQTRPVAADAALFAQGRPVALHELRTGAQALILLDSAGQVRVLDTDALASGAPSPPGTGLPGTYPPVGTLPPPTGGVWLDAVVVDVQSGTWGSGGSVSLAPYRTLDEGEVQTYTLAPGAVIRDAFAPTLPATVQAGDRVNAVVQGTTVTEMTVTKRFSSEKDEYEGVITGLEEGGRGSLHRVTVEDEDGDEQDFWLTPGATLKDVDGEAIRFEDLEEGWSVILTAAGGVATAAEVTSHTGGRIAGVIAHIDDDGSRDTIGNLTLALYNEDEELETYEEYEVSEDAEILDERGRDMDFEDLEVGDKVLVQVDEDDDELVVEIELDTPGDDEEDEESGELYDYDEGSRGDLSTVTIRRNSRRYTYPVAADVELLDDQDDPVDDLETLVADFAGYDVTLTLRNGLVVRIKVN